ncbi:MAG: LPS assembly protein LptD [Steroidobacteraceae bacterium]|nr:LPS assembly protein LptD [Steroidobacteraceae bacterium]
MRPARTLPPSIALTLARTLMAALAANAAVAHAQDCSEQPASQAAAPSADGASFDPDQPIEFEADAVEAVRDGEILLKGDVEVRQGERRLQTRDALYDTRTQSFSLAEGLQYSDPDLEISGQGGRLHSGGEAVFDEAAFALPAINARGGARRIEADTAGALRLDEVRYTTCPAGNEDWLLSADEVRIDQRAGLGQGRGVRLDFKGVPILYTPFISFPVGDQRKSGFLFPTLGSSSSNGYSLSAPWYWNIAPNMDATFSPTWYSKRGARLDTEFRYLTSTSRGRIEAQYLPNDDQLGEERSLLQLSDRTDLSDRLRLDLSAANASDSRWFEDFSLGPEGTSISYLDRSAQLTWLSRRWEAALRAQNFQVIDDTIDPALRPHTILPQLAVRASYPDQLFGLTLGLDLEAGNFQHNLAGVDDGWRIDVMPEMRLPLRGAGVWLEPAARWRYTAYVLENEARPGGDSPTRSAPIMSLDGGLIFERPSGSREQRLITLEPRFMYLYTPYRNQDDLPTFDTARADLNLVQLFSTNRYVGADRLGDANQMSIGLTSRLLDAQTGRQFIAATIGQAYYFKAPRIALADERPEDPDYSDIIAELDLTAYADWNIRFGLQWDPSRTRSEKSDVRIQYQPEHDRVINLGYRFRRGSIEQLDASAAWPLAQRWSAYARWVHSLEDETPLDQFAGFEYRSCCWRLRLVGRRYVSDRSGDRDTSIMLQLELNGLSSVGTAADAFLERSIRGYSFAPPDEQP